jgi:hypothetical protein
MNSETYDKIIIGAGLYGLYATLFCAARGERVLVLECDEEAFSRATYINQARVHNGYHYPRSLSTAIKSKAYFDRFNNDYGFCIHTAFDQLYATSARLSWTSAEQFAKFCRSADIPCEEAPVSKYFKRSACDGAFLTTEYTYDAMMLKEHLLKEIAGSTVTICYNTRLAAIRRTGEIFVITLDSGEEYYSSFVLNATYAGINQVHALAGFSPFNIKYELCEIILCAVSAELANTGLTVMDGPFFSLMPFGKTGFHSLTAVAFTPHVVSYNTLPTFPCQAHSGGACSPSRLGNCNACPARPHTAWPYMSALAAQYLKDCFKIEYVSSLFSMKPILKSSEVDDSRPTVVRRLSRRPTLVSVLSGKINTVYDLDEVLCDE